MSKTPQEKSRILSCLRIFILNLLLSAHTSAFGDTVTERPEVDPPVAVIAHGGGAIAVTHEARDKIATTTNSLEALSTNYKAGHTLFELDFEWTRDGHLAAVHDWGSWRKSVLPPDSENGSYTPTRAEFSRQKLPYDLSPLTAAELFSWLEKHPGAYIVSDIKQNNARGLRYLAEANSTLATERIIPQLKRFSDYPVAKELGYQRIILTIYQLSEEERSDSAILEFAKSHALYAVTIPIERAKKSDLGVELKKLGVFVYAHTTSDKAEVERLKDRGVQGIYSSSLLP